MGSLGTVRNAHALGYRKEHILYYIDSIFRALTNIEEESGVGTKKNCIFTVIRAFTIVKWRSTQLKF